MHSLYLKQMPIFDRVKISFAHHV
ncbi:MAG: hypothetical protein JWQ28_193, partial [Pedobacter sp.]|nr:hypothetical protein [Pedobacter sp.]